MQKLTAVASFVVAAFLLTSCSDTDARVSVTTPTTVLQQGFQVPSFAAAQSTIIATPVLNPFCPVSPPFTAVLPLSIRASTVSLVITDVNVRFTDTSGFQVTLPGPVPTIPVGSALVEARQTRVFPLSFGLGCGFLPRGTMTVVVSARDDTGRMSSGQVTATVR